MATVGNLSITDLEVELRHAEVELAHATEARLKAHENENQWQLEVNSLRNLVEVRKKRMGLVSPPEFGDPGPINAQQVINAEPEHESHTAWTVRRVTESGHLGMTALDLLNRAMTEGRKMHRNYPYVATRELVSQKRIVRRGDRYYAPNELEREDAHGLR